MKNKFFTVVLALFAATAALFGAKNNSQVKGRVIEEGSGEPLSFATVSIHTDGDKVVTGATADIDGKFLIANLPYGEYTLKVSFMGYKTVEQPLKVASAMMDLGDLYIEEDAEQIAQAVVTEKVPLIEQKLDKLVMNVSERVSAQGSNALEILRKAPGVSIDMDGNIKLNGKAVEVWIDGRPSHLNGASLESLLKATDGTTIDKIEIISNPSAKYDAQGSGGILNIKTKKNFLKGFNGSVTAGYGGMQFDQWLDSYNGSLNLNYRGEKTNNFFSYGLSDEDMVHSVDSELDYGIAEMVRQNAESSFFNRYKSHTFRLGTDLFATKKHTLGYVITAGLRGADMESNKRKENFTDIFLGEDLLQRNNTDIETKDVTNNISANVNHTYTIAENTGDEITSNLSYHHYVLNNKSYQTNILSYYLPSPDVVNEVKDNRSEQFVDIFSAKTDFQKIVWGSGQLQAGAKWAMSVTDNNMDNITTYNATRANEDKHVISNFVYIEHIGAAYISLAKMFSPKFTASAGLRAEYTNSFGDWRSSKRETKDSYLDLFPTLFLNYSPSQNHRISFSYTRRIYRPGFSQLNPFIDYADANTFVTGNPELKPQYSNNLSLQYGFSQYVNLYIALQHTTDYIMQIPTFNDATGMKKLTFGNFGTQTVYVAGLALTELPLVKEHLFLTVQGDYLKLTNKASGKIAYEEGYRGTAVTDNGSNTFQGSATMTAVLPRNYKIELNGWGMTSAAAGYFVAAPQFFAGLGVKKSVLNNKMTIALNVNDLFRTMKSDITMSDIVDGVEKVVYKLHQPFNMQKIKLSLTYNFGTSKAVRRRNVGDNEEASRVGNSNTGNKNSSGK